MAVKKNSKAVFLDDKGKGEVVIHELLTGAAKIYNKLGLL